jgi:hypothetical protein
MLAKWNIAEPKRFSPVAPACSAVIVQPERALIAKNFAA